MSHYTGNRPGDCSVPRRKRSTPALKERPTTIALIRPLAAQGIFHSFDHHQTIDGSFARKETGLAPVLVVRGVAEQPHATGAADERAHTGVRKRFVVLEGCRVL